MYAIRSYYAILSLKVVDTLDVLPKSRAAHSAQIWDNKEVSMSLTTEDKEIILNSIRNIPDFPKPGIQFKDITTLLNNPEAFNTLMNHLENRYRSYELDYVAGIDARGFIFGSILADRLGVGFRITSYNVCYTKLLRMLMYCRSAGILKHSVSLKV